MRIEEGKNEKEMVAIDEKGNLLGKGYIYPSLASELYEKDRYNIFITIKVNEDDPGNQIKDFIFEKIMERAHQIRKEYKDSDVRVYHCCFSYDKDNIEYYKNKEGFVHDEGMHILRHGLESIPGYNKIFEGLDIIEDGLENEDDILKFIEEHRKIFRSSPYTVEEIKKFKEKPNWKSVSILHDNRLVANVIFYVIEKDGLKIGWVDDMFVSKEWRKQGLASYLMIIGLNYFKSLGLDESRLELWSGNKRAGNLYYKLGYELHKETQASIGKFI